MKFVNRTEELRLLGSHLDRPGASLLVVYGRRRIGKTAVLQRLLDGRARAAYHVATRSTLTDELSRLSVTLAEALDLPLLRAQPLTSAGALLTLLEGVREPATIVLDELPYLVETEPALPGLLQASWDRKLKHGPLKLIFCGSSIAMMEETFLSKQGPLFGRWTGQVRMGPLSARHLAGEFRGTVAEIIELAAIFGGVPGYLDKLDPARGLLWNVRHHLLQRGEPLYEEVPFLLREELREPRVYHAVLSAIAQGSNKFSEISSKIGLDRANLTRYLAVLGELGFVERDVPVTEVDPGKSRKGIYRICDPFVSSWFRFVQPHRDLLERGLVDEVVNRFVKDDLKRWLPQAVERVLRELVTSGGLGPRLPFMPAIVGRYWSPTAEVDVVGLDAGRERALAVEIKWTTNDVPMSVLDDLRRKVAAEPALCGLAMTYGLIVRGNVKPTRKRAADEVVIELAKQTW